MHLNGMSRRDDTESVQDQKATREKACLCLTRLSIQRGADGTVQYGRTARESRAAVSKSSGFHWLSRAQSDTCRPLRFTTLFIISNSYWHCTIKADQPPRLPTTDHQISCLPLIGHHTAARIPVRYLHATLLTLHT